MAVIADRRQGSPSPLIVPRYRLTRQAYYCHIGFTIVDTVFRNIAAALHQGEKVELRSFGSFRLRRRGPHGGRNHRSGDRVDVPSKRVAYFKPGKELINRDPPQPVTPPLSE